VRHLWLWHGSPLSNTYANKPRHARKEYGGEIFSFAGRGPGVGMAMVMVFYYSGGFRAEMDPE
jgi:hypothetical protein